MSRPWTMFDSRLKLGILRISGVPPLVFLLIYLAAIPTFGFVFTVLPPASFYAPYSRYEPSARADANLVAADIYASIERSLLQTGSRQVDGGWWIDPKELGISEVTIDANHNLGFTVKFTAWRRKAPLARVGWSIRASVPLNERIISSAASRTIVSRAIGMPARPTFLPPGLEISDAVFAPLLFKSSDPIMQAEALSMSETADQRLFAFARGRAGDPSGVSGQLERMTYLSAVTITTIGFGDIIPITDLARALVAFEAVLGWTLAGFFLNAAAHRLRR